MVALLIARSDVVYDGVAPNIVPRLGFRNTVAWFGQDDADFALVVECIGVLGVRVDFSAAGNDGGGTFGEDHWMGGGVDFVAGVVAGFVELGGVGMVVLADGEDVTVREWWEKGDGGELERGCEGCVDEGNAGGICFDDLVQGV